MILVVIDSGQNQARLDFAPPIPQHMDTGRFQEQNGGVESAMRFMVAGYTPNAEGSRYIMEQVHHALFAFTGAVSLE